MVKKKTTFHVCPGCGKVKYKGRFQPATYQLSTFLKRVLDKDIRFIELIPENCGNCKI
jgi:hypothetical protein